MLGDSNGNFTCFKYNGTNVVDYIIMSEDLIQQTLNCKVSNVIPCLSDCHCKVSFMLLALYRPMTFYFYFFYAAFYRNFNAPTIAFFRPFPNQHR